ncbi:hypothetical protein D3C80_1984120 [compost metagenome]
MRVYRGIINKIALNMHIIQTRAVDEIQVGVIRRVGIGRKGAVSHIGRQISK